MSDALTFRDIEAGLCDLADQRDDLSQAINECGDTPEREALIDQHAQVLSAIKLYVEAEIEKVDSIHALMRREKAAALVAANEAERLQAIANRHKVFYDFLKDLVLQVLQAKGKTKVDGKHGRFRVQRNSKDTVDVRQPELLPREFQRFEVRMSGTQLDHLARLDAELAKGAKPIEPSLTTILEASQAGEICSACQGNPERACAACQNTGRVPRRISGVEIERKSHLRIE